MILAPHLQCRGATISESSLHRFLAAFLAPRKVQRLSRMLRSLDAFVIEVDHHGSRIYDTAVVPLVLESAAQVPRECYSWPNVLQRVLG